MENQRRGLCGARDLMPSEVSRHGPAALARCWRCWTRNLSRRRALAAWTRISLGTAAHLPASSTTRWQPSPVSVSHDLEAASDADKVIIRRWVAAQHARGRARPLILWCTSLSTFLSEGPSKFHYPGPSVAVRTSRAVRPAQRSWFMSGFSFYHAAGQHRFQVRAQTG
jgi:hypothetical protein